MSRARVAAEARMEGRLLARNGESLLLVLGIPVLLLVFFSVVDVLPTGTDEPVDFLAPGILALSVMSTALVNLAIGTAFEREYGVLKRLGITPLTRAELLAAKTAVVVVVEMVQFAVIVVAALLLGWDLTGGLAVAAVAAVVASVAFAGLGLLIAGTLRGLVALAAANALYLVLLLLGGMVFPLEELPAAVRTLARALPSTALAEIFQGALRVDVSVPGRAWAVLVIWAVAAPVIASRTFRWEPSR